MWRRQHTLLREANEAVRASPISALSGSILRALGRGYETHFPVGSMDHDDVSETTCCDMSKMVAA